MRKILLLWGVCFCVWSIQGQFHEPVKWVFELNDLPSAEKEVLIKANIDNGWHLYDQNLPEGGPISTAITFQVLNGVELVGKPEPSRKPVEIYDKIFDMDLRWFEKTITFVQKIKVNDFKKFSLQGEVEFSACNDETCIPPSRESFSFDSRHIKNQPENVVPDTGDNVLSEDTTVTVVSNNDVKERMVTSGKLSSGAVGETLNATQATSQPFVSKAIDKEAWWAPVVTELKALGDATSQATDRSLIYIFIAGFFGGLIALLTPCVWPLLPMTVSFFLKRTKNRKKAISDAVLYGFSIIVIYLVMGLLITALFGASALNDLSTNAIFNILFFGLLVLFAVSFFGTFELVLPSSWTNKMDRKADTTTGLLSIFFMAFTLVLVSFSCTGPIIGTLLVEAASQGSVAGPVIGMFGFAFALAIPFALFAVFPNMLQNMPKSGGWLNSVKVVLGFLELALALKFLSVADLAYGWRILDREVFLVLWIIIFTLLGLYLLGKICFKHDAEVKYVSVPRLFLGIISLSFALYMVPGLWGAPLKAISAFAPPLYTQDFSLYDDEVHAQFEDYELGMEYAANIGKPVLIDFSGFGCVNCRKMEAAVWTDAKVKQRMEKDFVLITLMVDDKTRLPESIEIIEHEKQRTLRTVGEKWSYLQRSKFGANAQPYYIILDHSGRPLSPSYGYNDNILKFVRFLDNGKKQYQLQSGNEQ